MILGMFKIHIKNVQGLTPKNVRWSYNGIVRSVLTYEYVVWRPKTELKSVFKIQIIYLDTIAAIKVQYCWTVKSLVKSGHLGIECDETANMLAPQIFRPISRWISTFCNYVGSGSSVLQETGRQKYPIFNSIISGSIENTDDGREVHILDVFLITKSGLCFCNKNLLKL